jgi:hypothetical protein
MCTVSATGSDIDHWVSKRFEGCHNYWQFRPDEFLVFGLLLSRICIRKGMFAFMQNG